MGRTHPVCVDASPFVVTQDKLNEPRERGIFVKKQSVGDLKVHHGV